MVNMQTSDWLSCISMIIAIGYKKKPVVCIGCVYFFVNYHLTTRIILLYYRRINQNKRT